MTSLRWYHEFEARQLPSIKQAFHSKKINCSELRKLILDQVEEISKRYTIQGRASPLAHYLEAFKIIDRALTDFSANMCSWMPISTWPLTNTFQNLKAEIKRAGDLLGQIDEVPALTCQAERDLYCLALQYIEQILIQSGKENAEYDDYIIHLGISTYLDQIKVISDAMKASIKLYDLRIEHKKTVANVGVFSKTIMPETQAAVLRTAAPGS